MNNKPTVLYNDSLGEIILLTLEGCVSEDEFNVLQDKIINDPDAQDYYESFLTTYIALTNYEGIGFLQNEADEQDTFSELLNEFAIDEKTAPAIELPKEEQQEEQPLELIQKVVYPPREKRKMSKFQIFTFIISVAAILFIIAFPKILPPKTHSVEIATLNDEVGARWSDSTISLESGDALYSGVPLSLVSGLVEIQTDTGVELIIEGPAEFEFTKEGNLGLDNGKVYATVSAQGRGFTVATTTSKIIDLGTEFGVQADKSGNTQVQVYKGKVTLLAGARTMEKVTGFLLRGEAGVVSSDGTVSNRPFNKDMFVRRDKLRTNVGAMHTEGENAPPVVTIDGEQAKIILPTNQVNLSGSVYDEDGYTVLWTVQEKPVDTTVTFGDDTSKSTTATFDTAGDYVLRLTATDVGALTGYDEFVVKVRPVGFDGLEAHITFDNADPNLFVNSTVGIGYEGTIYGTPTAGTASSDAKLGTGALEMFNDAKSSPRTTRDYVTYNRFLGSDPALSVSVWFKCEDITTENTIIAKYPGDSSGPGWFIRVRNGDGSISGMVGSDWGSGIDLRGPEGTIVQNEWVHAVLTFEDGVQRLYQNGALIREVTGIECSAADIASQMTIGRRDNEDWAYFDGLIDEVRIYDYALSIEEVKSLYAGDGGVL